MPKVTVDGHTNMKASHDLWEFFWHAKDFTLSSKVDGDAEETQSGSYDGLRCAHKCPNVLRCSYDHIRILGEFEACLIICPSVLNVEAV